jgi:hypothetical protein
VPAFVFKVTVQLSVPVPVNDTLPQTSPPSAFDVLAVAPDPLRLTFIVPSTAAVLAIINLPADCPNETGEK